MGMMRKRMGGMGAKKKMMRGGGAMKKPVMAKAGKAMRTKKKKK
tara:strand:- start:254 stop:385 length:132 start_codon:yes stop_codon:yes gene_type:complete